MTDNSSLISLLYTSRNLIEPAAEDATMRDIVAKARVENLSSRITGALLFSGGKFAQVLEGSREAVEPLMARIAGDPRHDDVKIIESTEIDTRKFGSWSMAYLGKFPAAGTYIDAAHSASSPDATDKLIAFMVNGASASLD